MIFVATLWPPAQQYFDEIKEDIEKQYKISHVFDYVLTKDKLEKVVQATYKPDKTPSKRLKQKLKSMNKFDPKIRMIYIDVPNPTMVDHKKARLKGQQYCSELKLMKSVIREKFAPKVKHYIFDVIIHVGDNVEHTRRASKIRARYCE